jgi:hypothetical protein
MDDSMINDSINPFDPTDPPRDEQLAALLREATGDVPVHTVNWDALASRIARSIPQRAASTWWSYAERWERRMLPLAFAASLLGAIALWNIAEPSAPSAVTQVATTDIFADVLQGAPTDDAALRYARTVTSEMTIADVGTE